MLETSEQDLIITMATELNLLRTVRRDTVVLSYCVYILQLLTNRIKCVLLLLNICFRFHAI